MARQPIQWRLLIGGLIMMAGGVFLLMGGWALLKRTFGHELDWSYLTVTIGSGTVLALLGRLVTGKLPPTGTSRLRE